MDGRGNMERVQGLYVTLSPDGTIKRTLTTNKGEVQLETTTVADEIILFSELSYGPYAQVVDAIRDTFADAHVVETREEFFGQDGVDEAVFAQAMQIVNDLVVTYEEEQPLSGSLMRFMLEDTIPPDDGSAWYLIETGGIVVHQLSSIMLLQFLVNEALYDLSTNTPLDLEEKYKFFSQIECIQVISLGETLETQYRFRSEIAYLGFLMMHFITSHPNVARCQCCGRFFIPKTRKRTLYCDRELWNGKTCKEHAPVLKHKIDVKNNPVLEAFDRAKQRMYKRYDRAVNSTGQLPKGITYGEYYEWLDAATEARDQFLKGSISGEDALKIIEGE